MKTLQKHSGCKQITQSDCRKRPTSSWAQKKSPVACVAPKRRPGGLDRVEAEEFGRALREMVMIEREVESAKIELALKSDFNLYDFFSALDVKGNGTLT